MKKRTRSTKAQSKPSYLGAKTAGKHGGLLPGIALVMLVMSIYLKLRINLIMDLSIALSGTFLPRSFGVNRETSELSWNPS
jgi:hypothetical protein